MLKIYVRKTKNWDEYASFSIVDSDDGEIKVSRDGAKRLIRLLKVALKKERRSDLLAFMVKEE